MCNSKMVTLFKQAKVGKISFNEMFEKSLPTINGILATMKANDELSLAYLVLAEMMAGPLYYEGEMESLFQPEFQNRLKKAINKSSRRKVVACLNQLNLSDDGGIADAEDRCASEAVLVAMNKLSPRQARVIELLYGLNGEEQHTLHEVAEYFGLTRDTITRLKNQALNTLRAELEQFELDLV